MYSFAEELMLYRKRKSLDQSQMAKLLGVSRQSISNYETGKTTPTTERYKLFLSLKVGDDDNAK